MKNGEMVGNRYLIEALVARGGMGSVYRVRDTKLNQKSWAVKEVINVQVQNSAFLDEVKILSDLSHPYIPKIVDYFEPNEVGDCYLVMEYINGRNLQEIFNHYGNKLPLEKILKYVIQLCDVLSYLHEHSKPIIFRDLKPSNIMIDEYDNIKLIDFGIARSFKQGQLTDTIAFGTIAFASPEQLENRQTDIRSDLYSLGATMYYLLSGGNYYYQSRTSLESLELSLPNELYAVIQQLLDSDPNLRYPSSRDVKEKLEQIISTTAWIKASASQPTVKISFSPVDSTILLNHQTAGIQDRNKASAPMTGSMVEKPKYSLQATHTTPALIIYLLDISGSMTLEMEGLRRIDVVRNALYSAIKQMVFRSTKGSRISSRYRMAVLAYSDQVYDLLGGVKSIQEIAQTGVLPDFNPMVFTDSAEAFKAAEHILLTELPNMTNCPAALICHMTDGSHTGEDPEPIVKRIMEMSVPDGNVLVENIFISDAILNTPITDVKRWQGIMPDSVFTSEVAAKLRNMSSVLPESYRDMMVDSGYSLKAGALMMLPGTSSELVSLGFQMSAATPISK